MVVELELELNWDRERKLTPKMPLELAEEVVEEFHSLVLGCLELVAPDCRGLVAPDCWELVAPDCWELVVPDCWELVEFQEIGAGEDPHVKEAPEALEVLLVMEAGEGPQVRVALGVLGQLLSCCFRRLDAMV